MLWKYQLMVEKEEEEEKAVAVRVQIWQVWQIVGREGDGRKGERRRARMKMTTDSFVKAARNFSTSPLCPMRQILLCIEILFSLGKLGAKEISIWIW